ncbi:MAG: hypothetical protein ABR973_00935 [Candidatus Acidiferrales bacterium]
MSRRPLSFVLFVFVALAIAVPIAARGAYAKDSKATTTTLDILNAATLGGKQIEPGTYRISADDSKVTLERNGKMVAEAPVQWKDETSKPSYSKIVTENSQIKEIHFSGKMRYIQIAE